MDAGGVRWALAACDRPHHGEKALVMRFWCRVGDLIEKTVFSRTGTALRACQAGAWRSQGGRKARRLPVVGGCDAEHFVNGGDALQDLVQARAAQGHHSLLNGEAFQRR